MLKVVSESSCWVQGLVWSVSACAALLLLIVLFHSLLFSDLFHRIEHHRLGTAETFRQAQPGAVVQQLLAYFRRDGLQLMTHPMFSYRERRHYQEVKQILNRTRTLGQWGVGVLTGLLLGLAGMTCRCPGWLFRMLAMVSRRAAIVLGGVAMMCGLFALSFESYFLKFHAVMFTSRNWLLPADSATVRLFPPQYFFDFLLVYTALVLGMAALLVGVAQLAGTTYRNESTSWQAQTGSRCDKVCNGTTRMKTAARFLNAIDLSGRESR